MKCPNCGKNLRFSKAYCPFCETQIPAFLERKLLEAARDPQLIQHLNTFVDAVLASPDLEDLDLANQLMSAGMSRELSRRLVAFATTAFGRYVLEARGAQFPSGFMIVDQDSGLSRSGLFSQEPIYLAARQHAERLGVDHPTVSAIAERSGEAQAIPERPDLTGWRFVEPIFLGIPLEAPPQPPRPWWKFWG